MDRDELISTLRYLVRAIECEKIISSLHSCNDCALNSLWREKKICNFEPDWGERVRYNCPFWTNTNKENING